MSVNNVSAIGRVVLPATASRPPGDHTAARTSGAESLVRLDTVTRQPIPPRFPWLSRLARELEPASNRPSPYGSAPALGQTLDRQA